MRKLFKLKTILTIVLLIIAICTQVSNVLAAENENTNNDDNNEHDIMPLVVNGYGQFCDDYVMPSGGIKYKYYIYERTEEETDFGNTYGDTFQYVSNYNVYSSTKPYFIKHDSTGYYYVYADTSATSVRSYTSKYFKKTCELYGISGWDHTSFSRIIFNLGKDKSKAIEKLKELHFNFDLYDENGNLFLEKTDEEIDRPSGNYFVSLENSLNELKELGWKDKEYVSMGGMPNYQYIHIRKQLNVMKDEYFQFLFSGSFYGVDDKSKIMNVSIQLFDEEGNASEMIPVEYSYSKEKGLLIKQKVSKSPINATQIELVVSLKDEYTSGSYGHLINEFDIANDSSGETNSWLGGIFDSITKLPELIVEGLSSLFQGIIDAVIGLGTFIVDGIVAFLQLIIDGITALGTLIVDTLKFVLDGILGALQFVIDGLISLGTFIIDGLKSLFIPSDDFFSKYFSDLYDFFSKKLGILLAPFDVLIMIVQKFLSISEGSGILFIPNINILSYQLINAQSFDLKGFFSTVLGSHYNLYYAFVDCILAVMLLRLAMKKFNSIVGGGVSNDN